uniref:VWFA domain-containing protein n=1 Tax=Romanomermis culicivorax TaxID=13658 RepID=A0A915JBF2_ROMCU
MMKSILISFVLDILLNYAAFSHAAACAEIDFNKIDVVFALDGSLSIGESNFKSSTFFLIDIVGQLQIRQNKASVGISQYPLDSQGN